MVFRRTLRGGQRTIRFLLAFYYQLDHLVRELMKFGTVGAFAYVIDIGLYNLLRATVLEDKTITAKVVSVTVATGVAFLGNRHWTFRHRTDPGLARGFGVFALLNGIAMVITVIPLWISHYLLGMTSLLADNISTNIIGTALATAFRFWSYRKWVFVAPPEPSARTPDTPAPDAPAPDAPATHAAPPDSAGPRVVTGQSAAVVLPPQQGGPGASLLTAEARARQRR
ncbi:MAG TPA: GtrA family protein [Actinomycetes bacterium]|nr:GtrA family protein [Actinomycetes bacterium]